jgi:hypothetical protein
MVLGIVVIAQASAINSYYFPLVYLEPTITPIPTATPKPTECLNQVFFIQGIKVCFTDIDYKPTTSPLDEWVTVKNLGNNSVELEGWRIVSDSSTSFKYDLPKFTLKTGQTVKVWTKIGTNSSSVLYMNQTNEFWKDNQDCGYLKDADRATVNSFCYGITGFTAAPADK